MPKSMTIRSPSWSAWAAMALSDPVGADRLRLGDVELDAPFDRRPGPRPAARRRNIWCASTSRLWSARGTTVPMITASTSAAVKPSSSSSWCSQTAYSSAVRRGSVAIRQRARIAPSSTSAKTRLVLPASTASSMASALRSGTRRRRG